MHNVTLLGLLAVPLLGSVLIFALPNGRDLLAKQVALIASVLTLGYAIGLGVAFKTVTARAASSSPARGRGSRAWACISRSAWTASPWC